MNTTTGPQPELGPLDRLIANLIRIRLVKGGDLPVVFGDINGYEEIDPNLVDIAMFWREDGQCFLTEEQRQAEPDPDDYDEAPDVAILVVAIG